MVAMAMALTSTTGRLCRITLLLVLLLTASSLAAASGVSMGVDEQLHATLLTTATETESGAPKLFTFEAKNTGSASFTGRIRFDVRDEENRTVFRTWSDPIDVAPGALAAHRFAYTAPDRNETMTAVATLHYGTKRRSTSTVFNTTPRQVQDGFNIRKTATYKDHVRLHVAPPAEVDTFYVTINDQATRRFTQTEVRASGRTTTVDIPYHPALAADRTVPATITISSRDGKYHYTGDVSLNRTTGIGATIDRWISSLLRHVSLM